MIKDQHSLQSLRVLIVDDSQDDAFLTLRMLRKGGFNSIHQQVESAQQMRAALQNERWDIVLTDHSMPKGFDSIQAITILRELDPDLPIIILSGAIGEDTAVAAMKAGGNDYVMKDDMARLVPAIRRELNEAEIRRDHKRIQQASIAKSQFLANMSHEIRTPMNGVLGMASLLLDTELTSEQREYANAIQSSADALLDIVNDILDISKIEAGKLELDPISFDLPELAADVVELLSVRARDKNLPLYLRVDPALPRMLVGDPLRIRQILINFLSNAIKFTLNGQVLLDIRCLDVSNKDVSLSFSVVDTGIGIVKEKLNCVFEEYLQAERAIARQYGGTGLGLTICRKLANLMGGTVSATSTKDSGSAFSLELTLPVAGKPRPMPEFLSNRQILLLGEPNIGQNILDELLKGWGATVICGEVPQLDWLLQEDAATPFYDLIIFDDLALGNRLVQYRQQRSARLPLIYLPVSGERGEHRTCQELGIDGYLNHPLRIRVLDLLLSRLLKESFVIGRQVESRFTLYKLHDKPPAQLPHSDHKVLLVEDNPINQKVASRMLEKLGCWVDLAANGEEAVEKWRQENYDLVFMDCQMPVMDGYEATRRIRELEQATKTRTPIIALTANAMSIDRNRCLEAGMDEHLAKPISRDLLRRLLEKMHPVVRVAKQNG